MTYKCAVAGVPYGGGKGVIIGDPKNPKNKDLLRAYADRINLLNGNFYTGEDVGISKKDVRILVKKSKVKKQTDFQWKPVLLRYKLRRS